MEPQLKKMLMALQLSDKWLSLGVIDIEFVVFCHQLLGEAEAGHIRTKFYAKFMSDGEINGFSNREVALYLSLVELEPDSSLKNWAVGFLVESGLLTLKQLVSLRGNSLLQEKHKVFLEREIGEKSE